MLHEVGAFCPRGSEAGTPATYDGPISLRIASIFSALLLAATAVFVFTNRSQLESQIDSRQADYASCTAQTTPPAGGCGWRHLSELRRGDLLGLVFVAVGLGLFLLLVYKIRHPGGEERLAPMGDSRADDALM